MVWLWQAVFNPTLINDCQVHIIVMMNVRICIGFSSTIRSIGSTGFTNELISVKKTSKDANNHDTLVLLIT